MDVGTHGQRLAEHNRDPDIMDTTIDSAENAPSKGKATDIQPGPDAPATKEDVSAATGPSQVLERPREGGDGARESPLQKRKPLHRLSTQPFSCRAWVDTRAMW